MKRIKRLLICILACTLIFQLSSCAVFKTLEEYKIEMANKIISCSTGNIYFDDEFDKVNQYISSGISGVMTATTKNGVAKVFRSTKRDVRSIKKTFFQGEDIYSEFIIVNGAINQKREKIIISTYAQFLETLGNCKFMTKDGVEKFYNEEFFATKSIIFYKEIESDPGNKISFVKLTKTGDELNLLRRIEYPHYKIINQNTVIQYQVIYYLTWVIEIDKNIANKVNKINIFNESNIINN